MYLIRSFEPFLLLDGTSSDRATFFADSPELTDLGVVFGVAHEVELLLLEVLELGVVVHEFGDLLASEHEDSLDVEVGLFSKHEDASERVSGELGVNALHEATEHVGEHELDLSLVAVLLVFDPPPGVSVVELLALEHLLGLGHADTGTIGLVDEEGLVAVEVKVALGEGIKTTLGLLGLGSLLHYGGLLGLSDKDGFHGLLA